MYINLQQICLFWNSGYRELSNFYVIYGPNCRSTALSKIYIWNRARQSTLGAHCTSNYINIIIIHSPYFDFNSGFNFYRNIYTAATCGRRPGIITFHDDADDKHNNTIINHPGAALNIDKREPGNTWQTRQAPTASAAEPVRAFSLAGRIDYRAAATAGPESRFKLYAERSIIRRLPTAADDTGRSLLFFLSKSTAARAYIHGPREAPTRTAALSLVFTFGRPLAYDGQFR